MAKTKEERAAYAQARRDRRKAEGNPIKQPPLSDEQRAAHAAYAREWRRKRKEAGLPVSGSYNYEKGQRRRYRSYGLTEETYKELYTSQGGCCAICRVPLLEVNSPGRAGPRKRNTHIDHCHTTGKTRGILCSGCNLGLGHFQDDPSKLQAAIAYLAQP